MFSEDKFNQIHSGQPLPTPRPGDDVHRPNHPDEPHPPVGQSRPDAPKPPEVPITVIVNGTDKTLPVGIKLLSYEEVVKLAYGNYDSSHNIIYSVVYSNGPIENKKGSLVKGDSVLIQKGMIFNVGCSNKS